MRTLYCSDLHVRRRIDERFALQQLVQAAIKNKVAHFIAAGDLFDKQTNRSGPVNFFHRELDKLEEANINFYFIQGQHEFDDPSWLSGHRHACHLHKQVIDLGSHLAYGLDFQPFGKLQEELAEIPESCTMLVAHQTWGDWMGDVCVPQGEFAQVPGNITLLCTGDLHQWKYTAAKNADEELMIALSTGAGAQQKISEPDTHYYAIIDDGHIKKKTLKSRVFIDWPLIVIQEDLKAFMSSIDEALASAYQKAVSLDLPDEMIKPRLRVSFSYRIPETVRRVSKIVKDRALLFWKELPPEEKQKKEKISKKSSDTAVTPLSVLPEAVKQDESPEVFELSSRLLQASNPEEEFQRWWAEKMGEK